MFSIAENSPVTPRDEFPYSGVLLALLFSGVFILTPALDAGDFGFSIVDVEAIPGEPFAMLVEGDWTANIGGFQLSLQLPFGIPVDDLAISVDNTLVGELEPDFLQVNINLAAGELIYAVLFDALPPFDGTVMPPVGFPLAVAEITGTVPVGTPDQDLLIIPVDGLGAPPINNIFVVGVDSIPATSLEGGYIQVREPPVEQVFIRGDVNLDILVDIADIIFHLNYTFLDGPTPLCLDAGDANDDGVSDISDSIFLMYYLFLDGPQPWPPFHTPGTDFTPDNIGCVQGL